MSDCFGIDLREVLVMIYLILEKDIYRGSVFKKRSQIQANYCVLNNMEVMMKLFSLFSILTLLCTVLSAQIAVEPAGDGTTDNPYEIATLENLYWIAASDDIVPEPNQQTRWIRHYKQVANIDASATISWFGGLGWKPIGWNVDAMVYRMFEGSYNGQNFVIDGLYINRPDEDQIGLFGYTFGSTISNLGITNADITGKDWVGIIAGVNYCFSIILNCYSSGTVSGIEGVGGIAGSNSIGEILDSYNMANISSTGYTSGGIAGLNVNSSIERSYNTGDVAGYDSVGGITGFMINSVVNNCYNNGSISGTVAVGGLVGFDYMSEIADCYSIGLVTGNENTGGLIGEQWNSTTTNSYWNVNTSGQASSAGGSGRTTFDMTHPYTPNTYVGWDFVDIWSHDESHEANMGYPYLSEVTVEIDDNILAELFPLTIYNYPNPFNPETTIVFNLGEDTESLTMKIFNIRGQSVRNLITARPHLKGEYSITWDGRDDQGKRLSSGVYLAKIVTPDRVRINRMILLK